MSIVLSSQGHFKAAAVMILVAALFDTFDGLIARLLKTMSQFGVELDSLADVVSFGAAPAFLIYSVHLHQYGWLGVLISSLPLAFGAFRLARFNIQLEDIEIKQDFSGLPIPTSAITISSIVIGFYNGETISEPISYIIIPTILLLSYLMVSKVRYSALPKLKDRALWEKFLFLLFLIFALLFLIFTDGRALFYFLITFVFFGIIRKLYFMISGDKDEEDDDDIFDADEEMN